MNDSQTDMQAMFHDVGLSNMFMYRNVQGHAYTITGLYRVRPHTEKGDHHRHRVCLVRSVDTIVQQQFNLSMNQIILI